MKVVIKLIPQAKPTVFSGPGSSGQLCETIAHFGINKVLIVTDAMLVKLGLLDNIQQALSDNGVDYMIYDGVEPDPTFTIVEQGLSLLKQHQCDALLAIGGGSSIDAAKVIALAATNKKSPQQLAGFFKARTPGLPLFAIPTTAGTGSEVTVAAVISDADTHEKKLIADPKTVPLAAALDPVIMKGLPPQITAATGMDALTHAIEAYIATFATAETDAYASAAVRMIFDNLPKAFENGDDLKAREAMAQASFYAGLAFTKAFVGYVHAIAHQFGGIYSTPHGLANAIVLPHILEYSKDTAADRLAELAIAAGIGENHEPASVLAQKFVDRVYALNEQLNIPEKLDALKSEDIPRIACAALKEAHFNYPVPKYMNQAQCETILHKMVS